jgi:hypothetical protein
VLWAAEKQLRIERVVAGLPDGDNASDLFGKMAECEREMVAQPARTHAGLIAQFDLLKRWIGERSGISPAANVAAIDTVAASLRDWARGEQ